MAELNAYGFDNNLYMFTLPVENKNLSRLYVEYICSNKY